MPARDYALCRTKKFPEAGADSLLIKPLLRELVRSRWLDIGHVLFVCVFIDLVTEKKSWPISRLIIRLAPCRLLSIVLA